VKKKKEPLAPVTSLADLWGYGYGALEIHDDFHYCGGLDYIPAGGILIPEESSSYDAVAIWRNEDEDCVMSLRDLKESDLCSIRADRYQGEITILV